MKGKTLKVPQGYQGVIAQNAGTEKKAVKSTQTPQSAEDQDDVDQEEEATGVLEEIGSFDEVIVWGHDSIAGNDDAFVKGMAEWISFSEAVRFHVEIEC